LYVLPLDFQNQYTGIFISLRESEGGKRARVSEREREKERESEGER
jgi:hypothetical protein